MDYGEAINYVAYVCSKYERKSLKKVLEVVHYCNEKSRQKTILLVSGVPAGESDSADMMNVGFIDIDKIICLYEIKALIVDGPDQLEESLLIQYLGKGIPCIVCGFCSAIKEICVSEGCGLYYADQAELFGVLRYFLKKENRECIDIMCKNACAYGKKKMSESCDENIIRRIQDRDKKVRVGGLEKSLVIVCSDAFENGGSHFELLLIYQYIKLYINEKAKLYLLNVAKDKVKIVQELIKELYIEDVNINVIQKESNLEADDILLTFSGTCTNEAKPDYNYVVAVGAGKACTGTIWTEKSDVEYVAEFIGNLLYKSKGWLEDECVSG